MARVDICEQITNSTDNQIIVQKYLLTYLKHLIIMQYSSQNYNIMEYVVLH